MKLRLTPLAISLCLLGLVGAPAYADSSSDQIQAMQNQINELQQEVSSLKAAPVKKTHHAKKKATASGDIQTPAGMPNLSTLTKNAEEGQAKADKHLPAISGPSTLPRTGVQYLPIDIDVPGQSFVSTGPYIGVPLQYSGSDLIINSPNVNEDVLLLTLRKNVDTRLEGMGLKPTDFHSHVLLSGIVEGQANYVNAGGSANSSGIDLTSAGIDAYILTPSPWVSGLISLNYDNNIGAQDGSMNTNSRSVNSRVFVNKAFIAVGNFEESPFYGSIGQMYVPFGVYSTSLVSSPLTKLLFRTQQRAAVIGFQQQKDNAFYGAGYIFNGDSYAGATSRLNNGGINLGYKFATDNVSGKFGAGAIANVADSQGLQGSGASTFSGNVFSGFGGTNGTGSERLIHRVPGYDFNALLSLGKSVDMLAEFITASTAFSPNDLTMKAVGAKPKALNTELAYTFQNLCKPTSITAGYGMSKDAVTIGLPAQRYSLVLNTSLWRNTLESLEFRHDINYALSAASTSSGSNVPGPTLNGRNDNVVTAQFDIYF